MAILFISDLHLSEHNLQVAEFFCDYLATLHDHPVEKLYILGDLFEVWIGDDAATPIQQQVIDALKRCTDQGVELNIMRGNRDFLYGPRFAAQAGARLLDDPCVAELYGQTALLMHGDTLCSDDHAYQEFRRRVRDPRWQVSFLALPAAERWAMARNMRDVSQTHTCNKAQEIMDVNPQTVVNIMKSFGVRNLIHGHTHRPQRHHVVVDGTDCERFVLGDWTDFAHVLFVDGNNWRLEKIDIQPLSQQHQAEPPPDS